MWQTFGNVRNLRYAKKLLYNKKTRKSTKSAFFEKSFEQRFEKDNLAFFKKVLVILINFETLAELDFVVVALGWSSAKDKAR